MGDIRPGTIDTEAIYRTHRVMRDLVDKFNDSMTNVNTISNTVLENWVGSGRNAFESQYKLLIKKIDDFGDTIKTLYDALVESETKFEDADLEMHQQLEKSLGN